jgi:hypothetical protein
VVAVLRTGDQQPSPDTIALAEAQIVDESKRIEFYITEYSVELLAQKMEQGEYVVPPYQREYTWEGERKSRFIESIIMGLPIPFLFFWEMPDGRLEIVDGSQRLRTIHEFIYRGLRLGELDPLTHVGGLTFNELPASRRRKILNKSIRGIVLNENADESARLDMFERINTGSKQANKAEIRRGALAGLFLDLVIKLGNDPVFKELAPMSTKDRDERGYEELITRFFAYGDGLDDYKDRPADFMFSYSKKMNSAFEEKPELADSYRDEFQSTMEFVARVFPHGFRRTPEGKFTPRARFEAIAIGARLALRERPSLKELGADTFGVSSWLGSPEFREITGADGANAIGRLRGRIDFVRNRLVSA